MQRNGDNRGRNMNKKSIREIIWIINDVFHFLVGTLSILAIVGMIIKIILMAFGGYAALGLIALPFVIVFVLIPLIALGLISFIPVLFGILRFKAKEEKAKQKFLTLNIVSSFICSILLFVGSFGSEYVIDWFISSKSVLPTIEIIVLLISIIMLILNFLLLVFTIYIEIPTITDQNDEWKDYYK